uniref:Pentatricopeptide repeat-containing protein At2g01860 n=1 Tax=Anthurium amnicola TaxID=1678845 RepID=A0A1D1YQX0_9ARAE
MENVLATSLRPIQSMPEVATAFFGPSLGPPRFSSSMPDRFWITASGHPRVSTSHGRKIPKNLRYPRRAKVPPDPGINRAVVLKKDSGSELSDRSRVDDVLETPIKDDHGEFFDESVWSPQEMEVLSSLFERKIPPKVKLRRERAHSPPAYPKTRLVGSPTPKRHVRSASRVALSLRSPVCNRVYKNPEVLVKIAKEIRALPPDLDASEVLCRWAPFLRKGSLSMTIRELGHMGLPERALQTLCWAQQHRPVFPDDRILSSTVEVLARNGHLKMEVQMERYLNSASRMVMEAMARGFIKAGNVNLTRKILLFAKDHKRTLDSSIHAKLILEAGKNPDRYRLIEVLLDELGEREDLDLKPQDCTAIMKVCIRLGRFESVESLFEWFKQSGRSPTVVMYTTVIHSRYHCKKYREGLAAVWAMEESNCLLDLPAYRVVIRLCVALGDLARAARYFSRLKEAGFAATYDIYRDMIISYAASGRLAKCKQICKEVEMAGLKLDRGTEHLLLQMEGEVEAVS